MDPLRIYLLAGLVLHKAVWEVMKRSLPQPARPGPRPLRQRLIRLVKTVILVGILVQTATPEGWLEPLLTTAAPAARRALGAALYSVGLALALAGRIQLGDRWSDIEAAEVRPDHGVVDRGIYRLIRHPIYVGDLLLLIGLELALNSWFLLGALLLVPFVLRQAVREERMLAATLDGYADYCRRTKRFLPYLA